ncbi:MAG: sulfite exporter TauE/SafE family protein [Candidatus Thorarchaeota archaeon]
MQAMIVDVLLLAFYAVAVGAIASMLGIGGGIFNTPILILVFFFDAQHASATALVAALFVAAASVPKYWRQNPRPIIPGAGLFLAITTIPGSLAGVFLRTVIAEDYALRLIFGISLFPVAIKMLFAKRRKNDDKESEIENYDFSSLSRQRLAYSLFGAFIGGVAAGLLGIGGGAIIVPVLSLLMGLPMLAAVSTSMFTMIFTASAGTVLNFFTGFIDPAYALALGAGMVVGAQIGPPLAARVNAVQLKRAFGLVLVFPLIKMMRLGSLWLDPGNQYSLMSTVGDIAIWLVIVIPIGLIRYYQIRMSKDKSLTSQ